LFVDRTEDGARVNKNFDDGNTVTAQMKATTISDA
jgi:hypothetical protein